MADVNVKKTTYALPLKGSERVQMQLANGQMREVMFANGSYTTSDADEVKALDGLIEKGYVRKAQGKQPAVTE